jgi:hypothetical protein
MSGCFSFVAPNYKDKAYYFAKKGKIVGLEDYLYNRQENLTVIT